MNENDEVVLIENEFKKSQQRYKKVTIVLLGLSLFFVFLALLIELIINGDLDDVGRDLDEGLIAPFILSAICLIVGIVFLSLRLNYLVSKKIILTNKRIILHIENSYMFKQKEDSIPLTHITSIDRVYPKGKKAIELIIVKSSTNTILFPYNEDFYSELTKLL